MQRRQGPLRLKSDRHSSWRQGTARRGSRTEGGGRMEEGEGQKGETPPTPCLLVSAANPG